MVRTLSLDAMKLPSLIEEIILSIEGVRLFDPGTSFDQDLITILKELGFDPIVLAQNEKQALSYAAQTRRKEIPLQELSANQIIATPIFDQRSCLLAPAGLPLSKEQYEKLEKQGVTKVFVEAPLSEKSELQVGRLMIRLQEYKKKRDLKDASLKLKKPPIQKVDSKRLIENPDDLTPENLEANIESLDKKEFEETPQGEALQTQIEPLNPEETRPETLTQEVIQVHSSVLRDAEQIFAQVRAQSNISGELIGQLSNNVIRGLVNDQSLSLNLSSIENSPYYLVSHAINVVLLATNIAAELGFAAAQIHELAYGALLHDVGMLRLPPEVMNKKATFSPQERRLIQQHPIIGINILQKISQLPKTTPLVVYQENERLDGSGYPRGRRKDRIHTYAKIVSVAAAYEAMISNRPYRQALHPYQAMKVLLHQVSQKKYDGRVVRALLRVLSLFPIGSWVKLSNEKIARVIAANKNDYTRPVVCILSGEDKNFQASTEIIDLAKYPEIKIIETLDIPEGFGELDLRTFGFH